MLPSVSSTDIWSVTIARVTWSIVPGQPRATSGMMTVTLDAVLRGDRGKPGAEKDVGLWQEAALAVGDGTSPWRGLPLAEGTRLVMFLAPSTEDEGAWHSRIDDLFVIDIQPWTVALVRDLRRIAGCLGSANTTDALRAVLRTSREWASEFGAFAGAWIIRGSDPNARREVIEICTGGDIPIEGWQRLVDAIVLDGLLPAASIPDNEASALVRLAVAGLLDPRKRAARGQLLVIALSDLMLVRHVVAAIDCDPGQLRDLRDAVLEVQHPKSAALVEALVSRR